MKKLLLATMIGVIGLVGQASAADIKVGIVDLHQIAQKSPQMVRMASDMQKQFKPRESKIVEQQKSLQAELQNLERNGVTMDATAKAKLIAKIESDKKSFQAMVTSFQQDTSAAQAQMMQKANAQLSNAVSKVAKDEKLDIVLQKEVVPYFSSGMDVTDKVIAAMK